MLEQVIDEVEVSAAVVKAGVDMRETDIDQAIDLVDVRRGDDGFHGELHRLAELAVEPILVELI
jgi:hypothetical protein